MLRLGVTRQFFLLKALEDPVELDEVFPIPDCVLLPPNVIAEQRIVFYRGDGSMEVSNYNFMPFINLTQICWKEMNLNAYVLEFGSTTYQKGSLMLKLDC